MTKSFYLFEFQIEKLRTQAEEQEANLLAQEEEVHGKQRELDALKDEEKQLMEDIKASEKEINKFEHDLQIASEINSEVKRIHYRKCPVKALNHKIGMDTKESFKNVEIFPKKKYGIPNICIYKIHEMRINFTEPTPFFSIS